MQISVFCATHRGYLFLERLLTLSKEASLSVFSFREEPWEPPYFEDIRRMAVDSGAQFIETKRIDVEFWDKYFGENDVDLMFAVSWRYMIPAAIYRRANKGAFVFHDSLLPKYRGFSPTVWAMINGEGYTGVTLFEMVADVDAGDIVDQESVPIGPDDRIANVVERVTEAYLLLLERNLELLARGEAPRKAQDQKLATYTCRLRPEDCCIDWRSSTQEIYNLIRAYSWPYPGAYTYLSRKVLRVWDASFCQKGYLYVGRIPGRVAEIHRGKGAVVLTGDGSLFLRQVQLDGQEMVAADSVLKDLSVTLGNATCRIGTGINRQ